MRETRKEKQERIARLNAADPTGEKRQAFLRQFVDELQKQAQSRGLRVDIHGSDSKKSPKGGD
jgi:hypothetical protein